MAGGRAFPGPAEDTDLDLVRRAGSGDAQACAALVDRPADRVSIYYGAADTVVCLAHAHLSELLAFVRG